MLPTARPTLEALHARVLGLRLDANHDGKLEVSDLSLVLLRLDDNGDGILQASEWGHGPAGAGKRTDRAPAGGDGAAGQGDGERKAPKKKPTTTSCG